MLSSWNAVLQLRETRVVLGFNGADEPDPIVDSVDCRSANMGRALGPSKDGPRSTLRRATEHLDGPRPEHGVSSFTLYTGVRGPDRRKRW